MTKDTGQKPKPPTPEEYRAEKISMALSYAPSIRPCKECAWPVLSGYCCTFCGSVSP